MSLADLLESIEDGDLPTSAAVGALSDHVPTWAINAGLNAAISRAIDNGINVSLNASRYAAPHFGVTLHDVREDVRADGCSVDDPLLAFLTALARLEDSRP